MIRDCSAIFDIGQQTDFTHKSHRRIHYSANISTNTCHSPLGLQCEPIKVFSSGEKHVVLFANISVYTALDKWLQISPVKTFLLMEKNHRTLIHDFVFTIFIYVRQFCRTSFFKISSQYLVRKCQVTNKFDGWDSWNCRVLSGKQMSQYINTHTVQSLFLFGRSRQTREKL